MKFPKELSLPVDHARVNWPVMKEWVARRVTELLGIEEEVLIGTIHNYLIDQKVGVRAVVAVCGGSAAVASRTGG
jgi:serine/arginine repetitive matrix protein 1